PGTSPPPSTRSNSPMPDGACTLDSTSIAVIGRAARATGTDAAATIRVGAPCSTSESHVWHSPQRPTHFTLVQPHSRQAYPGDAGRAMRPPYVAPPTPLGGSPQLTA